MGVNGPSHDGYRGAKVLSVKYALLYQHFIIVTFSYAAPGLQAVLELYFSTFLYVCSKHAVRLASTSVNVYIAVYQICALLGGYLADRILGKTDVVLFD